MRVYVASASKGDRTLLQIFVRFLTAYGHFVFAPLLGFQGGEDEETREKGLAVCFFTIKIWAEVFVAFDEKLVSSGMWDEHQIAMELGLPSHVFSYYDSSLDSLLRWLNELQSSAASTKV